MKRKAVAGFAGLCVLFAAVLIVLSQVLPLIPEFETLPAIVTFGLPLGLAWLVAAGVGGDFVPARRALAVATVCLVVAAPLMWWGGEQEKEQEYAPVWTPPVASPPENVPENLVAFRFVSAFTYVEGDGPIFNVELELPWPYIDDRDEFGRPLAYPVGLENWLVRDDLSITLAGLSPPSARVKWDVWRLDLISDNSFEDFENLLWEYKAENDQERLWELHLQLTFNLENAVWSVDVPIPGVPLENVGFATAKLYRDGVVAGNVSAYHESRASSVIFQKVNVRVVSMSPGDTVAIEGIFFVHEDNADKVRLDDWIESEIWRTFKPDQENAPYISVYWEGDNTKTSVLTQLEKSTDGEFFLVIKYEGTAENLEGNVHHGSLVSQKISQ